MLLYKIVQSFSIAALSVQCPVANVNYNPWLPIRSADGTCNNLVHPLWGSRHAAFSRLLIPPKYEDGNKLIL